MILFVTKIKTYFPPVPASVRFCENSILEKNRCHLSDGYSVLFSIMKRSWQIVTFDPLPQRWDVLNALVALHEALSPWHTLVDPVCFFRRVESETGFCHLTFQPHPDASSLKLSSHESRCHWNPLLWDSIQFYSRSVPTMILGEFMVTIHFHHMWTAHFTDNDIGLRISYAQCLLIHLKLQEVIYLYLSHLSHLFIS